MNAQRAFVRKVIYLIAVGLLLVPLFLLGHPAASATKGSGGWLAQVREDEKISPTELGQIDMTNETIKLATLGMRGVAADILWMKANTYQKKKDWTNLKATLEQITKVQPNFIEPWIHQGWNISYNVSVSFDLPKDKYYWLMQGIKFLNDGATLNNSEPRLLAEIAWYISYKLGKDDPWKQYRRLFREDDVFNAGVPRELRDNFLVGKEWYKKAEKVVWDRKLKTIKKGSILFFFSRKAMCQMDYADYLEKDGVFGEKARIAWQEAANEWSLYGDEPVPSPPPEDAVVYLNKKEMHDKEAERLRAQLEAIAPLVRAAIVEKQLAALEPDELNVFRTPEADRTPKQRQAAPSVAAKLVVTPHAIALQVTGPQHAEAVKLADEIDEQVKASSNIACNRQIVNFDYWKLRAEVEQTADVRDARRFTYQGDQAFEKGDLVAAKSAYDQGFHAWRKVLDRFPELKDNPTTPADIMDVVKRYRQVLKKLDEKVPKPFILQDIVDQSERK
jgi:hypothetical protein